MLKEELKLIDKSDEAVKKTGLSVGVVLILISLLLWYLGKTSFVYFSIICKLPTRSHLKTKIYSEKIIIKTYL